MIELSLSILGYEPSLDESIGTIKELLSAGADWLHVDVMREPFIPGKNTFLEAAIVRLYNKVTVFIESLLRVRNSLFILMIQIQNIDNITFCLV